MRHTNATNVAQDGALRRSEPKAKHRADLNFTRAFTLLRGRAPAGLVLDLCDMFPAAGGTTFEDVTVEVGGKPTA